MAEGGPMARGDKNASTATLSSDSEHAATASNVPDDPFDTRRALEVLQKAAEICALVEKVQVAKMQEHGYDVNDTYDPFDTSKARAVIESLKNSTVLASARKQTKLVDTGSPDQDQPDDDDPFNTTRALSTISKAVSVMRSTDRQNGKRWTTY